MTRPEPLDPRFLDVTERYAHYFERHRLFAAEGLPTIGSSPVKMAPSERLLLWTLAYSLRPLAYLEIGSLEGGSALIVASAFDAAGWPGRIVCVEPEPRFAPEVWSRLEARTTLLRGFSPEALPAARAAAGAPFGLALVDGDHSEAAVLADAEGLARELEDGAWVLFHDAHMPEVEAGIDRFVAADRARRCDLGWLNREYTSGLEANGNPRRWGGLRGVLVRH